jgi:ABC-2 type transport system ATP-binding protein
VGCGAGLDPDERLRLREILTERRRTTTLVVSTHLTDEAAISDTVVVLDAGTVRFAGSPARLAEVAAGRTWVQPDLPPPDVRASWRLADGRHRCLGTPPPGATLVDPTIEDGYLLVRA